MHASRGTRDGEKSQRGRGKRVREVGRQATGRRAFAAFAEGQETSAEFEFPNCGRLRLCICFSFGHVISCVATRLARVLAPRFPATSPADFGPEPRGVQTPRGEVHVSFRAQLLLSVGNRRPGRGRRLWPCRSRRVFLRVESRGETKRRFFRAQAVEGKGPRARRIAGRGRLRCARGRFRASVARTRKETGSKRRRENNENKARHRIRTRKRMYAGKGKPATTRFRRKKAFQT